MTIKEYLEKYDMTQKEFAVLVGVKPLTVLRWVNKQTWPDPRCLEKIIDVTGGEVEPNDIFI